MHVLITADTLGGVWVYTRELVTGLVERGVRVTLVSLGRIPTREQTAWLDAFPSVDFRPTAFRLEWMQESAADLERSTEYLSQLVREVQPDLLHLNQYCYGSLPGGVPRLVVAHSDVLSWWAAVHGEVLSGDAWLNWYRRIVTRGLSSATAVIAPSRWMLEQLSKHYVHVNHASVIYNGRSPAQFDPDGAKGDYVISVGRLWDPGKQVSLLAQCKLPVKTLIVGCESHPEEALRSPGLRWSNPDVQCLGEQSPEQLRDLFSRAALYAATSRYEPFGLAPLEAALSRCAIVANDIPSLREIWGDDACYFERDDAESLGATVARLHSDPDLRQRYADAAYQRACRRYSAHRMVDQYLSLYETLVGAGVAAA